MEPASITGAPGGFAAGDGRALAYADIVRGKPVVLDVGKLPEARLYTFDTAQPHRLVGRAAPLVQARDALLLGLAVRRPIKVEWSRANEFVADRTRPPSSHRVRIGADARGRMTDWWHAAVSGQVLMEAAPIGRGGIAARRLGDYPTPTPSRLRQGDRPRSQSRGPA